ncbi:uncharacterized protein SCHCODRAFT_02646128 [Schizophyllum commune H4-8]|uniref:Uncharacterized protein n=1 Tax=Schizophyllum commune (strain H4-8 / FGSC 9210) TaxID=578458 RepID=D8QME4_SCHCM|nr:uncharacterized protein SCHCODRAFT_02646128 [Schizophyllum commune H4-8]KAI5836563.1 hypothetical protein SCHCODRAFT_02646128 [Schizophyllum commune H4-8]
MSGRPSTRSRAKCGANDTQSTTLSSQQDALQTFPPTLSDPAASYLDVIDPSLLSMHPGTSGSPGAQEPAKTVQSNRRSRRKRAHQDAFTSSSVAASTSAATENAPAGSSGMFTVFSARLPPPSPLVHPEAYGRTPSPNLSSPISFDLTASAAVGNSFPSPHSGVSAYQPGLPVPHARDERAYPLTYIVATSLHAASVFVVPTPKARPLELQSIPWVERDPHQPAGGVPDRSALARLAYYLRIKALEERTEALNARASAAEEREMFARSHSLAEGRRADEADARAQIAEIRLEELEEEVHRMKEALDVAVAAAKASDGASQAQLVSAQRETATAQQAAADATASRDRMYKDAAAAQVRARQAASELDEMRRKLRGAEEELRTTQDQLQATEGTLVGSREELRGSLHDLGIALNRVGQLEEVLQKLQEQDERPRKQAKTK